MLRVPVGIGCAINGRLSHGARIIAHFDKDKGIVSIISPDADGFKVIVDTHNMESYTPVHSPTSDKLGGDVHSG